MFLWFSRGTAQKARNNKKGEHGWRQRQFVNPTHSFPQIPQPINISPIFLNRVASPCFHKRRLWVCSRSLTSVRCDIMRYRMSLTPNADGEIYAIAVADSRGTNRSEVVNKTSVSGGNRGRRPETRGNAWVEEEKMRLGENLRFEFKNWCKERQKEGKSMQ